MPATKSGQDARFSNFGGWHLFPLFETPREPAAERLRITLWMRHVLPRMCRSGGKHHEAPGRSMETSVAGFNWRVFSMTGRASRTRPLFRSFSGSVVPRLCLAVLFAAASLVSPGVCDACEKGCCHATGAAPIADAATPVAVHAARPVAACCQAALALCEMPSAEIEGTCQCQLGPQEGVPATRIATQEHDLKAWPVAWTGPATIDQELAPRALGTLWLAETSIPVRPARVLFGVWRE